MSGFVYIWQDIKNKRWYIGSHWGSVNDGYVCSSRWMRNTYKRRPNTFRRRILSTVTTSRSDLLKEEERWLQMIKQDEIGCKYYNLTRTTHHWHSDPDKLKSVGEKISKALKGRKVTNRKKPKPMTDEHRKNLSEAGKGRFVSEETKEKIRQRHLGRKRSNEFKAKRSELNVSIHTGMKRSEESKHRMSEAQRKRRAKN